MPPAVGDDAPVFTGLRCDGQTFRTQSLRDLIGDRGIVLVFFGFVFSAISLNWWKQYDRRGWDEFDGIPVVGVSRDGPYAQNEFLRVIDSPFQLVSDVDATGIQAYDLLVHRDGMGDTSTARRAVFVLDDAFTVRDRWIAPDWITAVPVEEIEREIHGLESE